MDNMTIINKLIPIAMTGLWVAGGINVIKSAYKGKKLEEQVLNLLAIGVGSVFITSCSTIFNFVKVVIENLSGLIVSLDFWQFLK